VNNEKPSLWHALTQPAAGTMLLLGFASGLPFLLVAGTLAYWLHEGGIELREITMLTSAGAAYSLKFLWAPLVDRWHLPALGKLGQRRSWLVLAMATVIFGLLAMATVSPNQLGWFIAFTLLVAFSGATLDIAVDAWRVEMAPSNEAQGALLATYSLGYRAALVASGALALVLADHVSWSAVYRVMALCMALPLLWVCFAATEPQVIRIRATHWRQSLREGVVEPFVDIFRRFGTTLACMVLLFILGMKISDQALVGGIISPFYLDQGFDKTTIAAVTKVYGIWIGFAGAFIGGLAVARWGIWWPLFVAITLGGSSNLLYLLLIGADGNITKLTLVISGENLAQGFLGTTAVAWMSALINQRYTATQYALFSSLIMLPGKVLGFFSGAIVQFKGGYGFYFLLSALLALPAVSLFFWLKPKLILEQANKLD